MCSRDLGVTAFCFNFRPHRHWRLQSIAAHGVAWSVSMCLCLCVCVCVCCHVGEPCKNSWTDRDAVWGLVCVSSRNHVLDKVKVGRTHSPSRGVTERRCGHLPLVLLRFFRATLHRADEIPLFYLCISSFIWPRAWLTVGGAAKPQSSLARLWLVIIRPHCARCGLLLQTE